MAENEDDPAFAALPHTLQRRIDAAFDSVRKNSDGGAGPPRKRRRLDDSEEPEPGGFVAGGFIPEEPGAGGFVVDEPPAGGFVVDEPGVGGSDAEHEEDGGEDEERHTHIPLSMIPAALQILDLPPDDEDVFSVFRNAASGWGGRRGVQEEPEDALVSRKDWRAVCTALLDTGGGEEDDVEMADEAEAAGEDVEEEARSDSGEEYVEESDAEDGEGSDDEYREGGGGGGFVRPQRATKASPKAVKRRSGRKAGSVRSSEEDEPRGLTARQKRECRTAFALFFPDVTEAELDRQRIGIKEITRVAQLLKEKITAEETVEMLEAFSSTPDKSMGLADFERMMVAAKLA
ncbi:hypothetical protein BD413DRAFT_605731 [Trametes elegans]|nr:hypothetical protein BD413DRAFT_605731 [Trametes elegans]